MITVSSGNQHYKSVEGILFNKDGSELICYPPGKKGTSYTVPDNVKFINKYAFYKCSSLSSIIIPDSVTSIGDYAFSWCSSLSSITIPENVSNCYIFERCDNLKEIIISSGGKLTHYPIGKKLNLLGY